MYVSVIRLICVSTDPPYIKDVRSSETAVGQSGVLYCEASAVPPPEFEWYRDERRSVAQRTDYYQNMCHRMESYIYISYHPAHTAKNMFMLFIYIYIYISSPYISDQENKFTFEEK